MLCHPCNKEVEEHPYKNIFDDKCWWAFCYGCGTLYTLTPYTKGEFIPLAQNKNLVRKEDVKPAV